MKTLILIDIQKEYTMVGRPYYLNNIESSLDNCRKILDFAREHLWDIIHIQHSNGEDAPKFNPKQSYFDFVDGFEPKIGEAHYVKTDFSCYSSDAFTMHMAEHFSKTLPDEVYIIGYNSVMCCLSTLEEARRMQHKMTLISDASLAKDIGAGEEHVMHETMLKLYQAKGLTNPVLTKDVIGHV